MANACGRAVEANIGHIATAGAVRMWRKCYIFFVLPVSFHSIQLRWRY